MANHRTEQAATYEVVMQIANFSPEALFHGIELIALAVGGWVGLKIQVKIQDAVAEVRQEQVKVKQELVANQTALAESMNQKHAENKQAIAVHQAEDIQIFKSMTLAHDRLEETLDRIEGKVDKMNGHTR